VLKRTNYGEADRIIQVITPEGKKSLMVRGARKEKSKLAGGIEVFSLSDITWHSGRGELDILTSARLITFYGHILEDYDKLQFGYDALKRITRSSEMLEDPDFFELLNSTLQALDQPSHQSGSSPHHPNPSSRHPELVSGSDLALIQAWFYLRLSKIMGESLNVLTDVNGEKLQANTNYLYDVENNAFVQSAAGNITADHIKLLRIMQINDIKMVQKIVGIKELLPEILRLAQISAKI